jgi:hypothetical protein
MKQITLQQCNDATLLCEEGMKPIEAKNAVSIP